ncbi:Endoribonuclease L-PSP (plasmid) [Rhizobium leguminosarum bv. trifolii WSM2304]|uniref:Endoribonuclease L-PSP n=1 Tax=Rhizobium leguminosarum bv. trifolii (strain WSM2304) TaxID=395492 RepID=A0ABF7QZ55_RHILW|nr:RidA family protein [Rhizobium leguminosarum]ACI59628.1 Endoribonuclease L-PSP [Rhizobium leguminosarum bv. trifolii WSM2304]
MITRGHTDARMSQIVTFQNFVFLAGQVGNPGDDIVKQTLDTLSKIDALLSEANSSREQILHAQIWLDDMRDFAAVNKVWEEWMPSGHAPARASGEVRVGRPGLKVEILVTAAQIQPSY